MSWFARACLEWVALVEILCLVQFCISIVSSGPISELIPGCWNGSSAPLATSFSFVTNTGRLVSCMPETRARTQMATSMPLIEAWNWLIWIVMLGFCQCPNTWLEHETDLFILQPSQTSNRSYMNDFQDGATTAAKPLTCFIHAPYWKVGVYACAI